jgi:small subunit ribosomal protein S27Ae
MGKKKEKERKGKRPKKKHEKKKKGEYYTLKEERIEKRKPFCPRCGAGVFMAEHKNRLSCGRCGFTEWKSKGDKQ